jgi:cardiolipin synthase
MVTCLCLAAKSGVDVRIIVPGIPDKWYAYYVTQSYYAELLQAGVRIYEYTPGFIHAKMYVSDDRVAIVGSANMDYRSLYLHFENCCAFYGGHMVQDVKADILHTLAESREVTQDDTENIPLHKWLAQIFFRFFAPLM